MKKAKLITSVSSLSVVSALVPIAATSCSSKDNGIEARMNIYSRAWTSSPTKEYTSILEWTNKEKVNFIDLDQQIKNEINNNGIHHVENLSDSELRSTFTADFKSIYIHPSASGTYKLKFNVTFNKDKDPSKEGNKYCITSSEVKVAEHPAYEDSKLVFDNKEYVLIDEINPNLFATRDEKGKYISQTYPLKNGETLTIDYSNSKTRAKLTSVILNSFDPKITAIGNDFLYYCSNITTLTLPKIWNITSIGNNFLHTAWGLTNLDLSMLSSIDTIGDYFLYSNRNLISVDLSSLKNVTSVGGYFMQMCDGITEINLSCLSNLESFGVMFLQNCKKLETLTLPSSWKVSIINRSFLDSCYALKAVTLPTSTNDITRIDEKFLYGCKALTSIELPSSWKITTIDGCFIRDCVSLTSITLPDTWNIETIGASFLYGCTNIKEVVFPDSWNNVTSIDQAFLFNCQLLERVDMNNIKDTSLIEGITSFSVESKDAPAFKNGVLIEGSYKDKILERFPNRPETETYAYRHLK